MDFKMNNFFPILIRFHRHHWVVPTYGKYWNHMLTELLIHNPIRLRRKIMLYYRSRRSRMLEFIIYCYYYYFHRAISGRDRIKPNRRSNTIYFQNVFHKIKSFLMNEMNELNVHDKILYIFSNERCIATLNIHIFKGKFC